MFVSYFHLYIMSYSLVSLVPLLAIASYLLLCCQCSPIMSDEVDKDVIIDDSIAATLMNETVEISLRIIGGSEVSIDDVYYQLYITIGRDFCGGSIISEYWALTAAHCVYGLRRKDVMVRSGIDNLRDGGVLHQTTEIVVHKSYNNNNLDNDIALLRVFPGFTMSSIRLASYRPLVGTMSTVSGWGNIDYKGSLDQNLRWVHVPIVDQQECQAEYKITERKLCAGYPRGGKGFYLGDSGGALVANGQQVGIVSSTNRNTYGVYTDVSKFGKWITDKSGVRVN